MSTENLHRVCIAGASGRMGRMLIEAVQAADDCTLSGALDLPTSPALGQDAAAFLGQTSGVAIASDLATLAGGSQVLIDFTRPEGTMALCAPACSTASSSSSVPPGFRTNRRPKSPRLPSTSPS